MKKVSKKEITKTQLNLLKKEVEAKFGRKVQATSSSKDLSEKICADTGQKLSYNTIRRFFGTVNFNGHISTTSLNILASYCGYASFNVFINEKPYIDIQELKHVILEFIKPGQFSIEKVIASCKKYGGFSEVYPFLEQCLLIAKAQNIKPFFEKFYTLPKVFELKPFNKKAIFDLAHLYAHLINNFDDDEKMQLLAHTAQQVNARLYYFEFFVDLNHINGYYGKALEYYIANNDNTASKLFYHELKTLQSFLNNHQESLEYHFSALRKHYPADDSNYHPFLQGRYFAAQIYYHKKLRQEEIAEVVARVKNMEPKTLLNAQLFLIPILQATQFTKNNNLLLQLLDTIPQKYIISHDYLTNNAINHLKIYFAHYAILKMQTLEAKHYVESINPQDFPYFESSVQSLSYYIMLSEYNGLNNHFTDLVISCEKVQSIAKALGFKYFENYDMQPK